MLCQSINERKLPGNLQVAIGSFYRKQHVITQASSVINLKCSTNDYLRFRLIVPNINSRLCRLLTQIKCGSFSIVDQLIIEYSMKVFINDFHALSQRLMTVDEAATVRGHEFIVEGMTIHHMHRCN